MQELTAKHTEQIIEIVNKAEITFSHLRNELIDHLCCEVESMMNKGLPFEIAYEKVKDLVGNKELKKIQEDTLILIDKKYSIMKKTMQIFGLVSMVLVALGAVLKIQHWPGAGILLTLGFLLLGLVFAPAALYILKRESRLKSSMLTYMISVAGLICFIFGFLFKIQHWPGAGILLVVGFSMISAILIPAVLFAKLREEQSQNMRAPYIIGALAMMTYLLGDLFKFQHWPGASILLILGSVLLTAVFLPIYAYKIYNNSIHIKPGFVMMCFGIFFFNIFSVMMTFNVSTNVLAFFNKPGEEILKTSVLLKSNSVALYEQFSNDTSVNNITLKNKAAEVKKMTDELQQYVENIKLELISRVDNISLEEARKKASDIKLVNMKDNFEIPTIYLVGLENNGRAYELKSKIQSYKSNLLAISNLEESSKVLIYKALDTPQEKFEKEGVRDWEVKNFERVPMIAALNNLSSIQRKISISETEVLNMLLLSQK